MTMRCASARLVSDSERGSQLVAIADCVMRPVQIKSPSWTSRMGDDAGASQEVWKLQWAGTKQPHQPTVRYVGFLDGSDSYCLGSFGSLPNLELNTLVFLERAIAASLDLGVVDKEVLRAVVRGDEAEAFVTVEPFHSSLCHLLTSLIQMRMYQKHPNDQGSTSWPIY